MSGVVAVILNLILPQEDTAAEDDDDVLVEVVDVEGQRHYDTK